MNQYALKALRNRFLEVMEDKLYINRGVYNYGNGYAESEVLNHPLKRLRSAIVDLQNFGSGRRYCEVDILKKDGSTGKEIRKLGEHYSGDITNPYIQNQPNFDMVTGDLEKYIESENKKLEESKKMVKFIQSYYPDFGKNMKDKVNYMAYKKYLSTYTDIANLVVNIYRGKFEGDYEKQDDMIAKIIEDTKIRKVEQIERNFMRSELLKFIELYQKEEHGNDKGSNRYIREIRDMISQIGLEERKSKENVYNGLMDKKIILTHPENSKKSKNDDNEGR